MEIKNKYGVILHVYPAGDLQGADLQGAHLRDADLSGADLRDADLSGADLRGADLRGTDLRGANLQGAHLRDSDLRGANLSGAHLSGADLSGANLRDSDLHHPESVITPEGELHVWKKSIDGFLVKLLIPSDAKRCNAAGRKCRASKAVVMEILGNTVACGRGGFLYELGKTVTPDSYDECRWNECSNGIHFFLTKEEAVRYIP